MAGGTSFLLWMLISPVLDAHQSWAGSTSVLDWRHNVLRWRHGSPGLEAHAWCRGTSILSWRHMIPWLEAHESWAGGKSVLGWTPGRSELEHFSKAQFSKHFEKSSGFRPPGAPTCSKTHYFRSISERVPAPGRPELQHAPKPPFSRYSVGW